MLAIALSVRTCCSWEGQDPPAGLPGRIPSLPQRETSPPARPSDLRYLPGEDKNDLSDRIGGSVDFSIEIYGRVVDQDGRPLKGVQVVPRIHRSLSNAQRLLGMSDFVEGSPVHTDGNGGFTISGYKGFTVAFKLSKVGYRDCGGGINAQPGFSQPGFPTGYKPDPDRPVEYMMIRSDMPPNKCVADRKFRIPWNRGAISLDLGKEVGFLVVEPTRVRDDPVMKRGFDWSIKHTTKGFDLMPLGERQPELRVAPTAGYQTTFTAGAKAADAEWISGINRTFAIRTTADRYGTMEVGVGSYDDENQTGFVVVIYLGQPGMRNIDRGGP